MKNEKTSGLQSIKAYLHDFENGKYYAVQKNGSLKEISKAQIGQIAPIKTNSQIVIKVPKNFKGQIYAIPTDKVTNTGKSFLQTVRLLNQQLNMKKRLILTLKSLIQR